MYKLIVIIIVFLLGLYFITQSTNIESFTDTASMKIAENCPDVLLQKGAELFLYNSKRAEVPGVNPIKFSNLEEYVEFTEWQRSQGILCPILFLQHAIDAQNNDVYKLRPSPTCLLGGLPDKLINQNIMPSPNTSFKIEGSGFGNGNGNDGAIPMPLFNIKEDNNLPNAILDNNMFYNQKDYPSFDSHDQGIGLETPLDKLFNENNNNVSPNPMDHNWGGSQYTQSLIDKGVYSDNEVTKTTFNMAMPPLMPAAKKY